MSNFYSNTSRANTAPIAIKPGFAICKIRLAVALALLGNAALVQAACNTSPNPDGSFTCTGNSSNVQTYDSNGTLVEGVLNGMLVMNNNGSPVSITNQTTNPSRETVPFIFDNNGNFFSSQNAAVIRNRTSSVGGASTISATGNTPVVVNNIGGRIEIENFAYNPIAEIKTDRVFDPTGWAYDATARAFTNNGVQVGYTAAISAGLDTPSLTINNSSRDFGANGVAVGFIVGQGDFSAGIYTNTKVLTINNDGNSIGSVVSKVASFGGATYTDPVQQDGTQYATNVVAGTTIINNTQGAVITGSILVVDRNPLLTEVQAAGVSADPSLASVALPYTQADIGPRNSIINNNSQILANISLGSGAHIINSSGANGIDGSITVDQSDSVVTDSNGNPLYRVHGDRTFTLNIEAQTLRGAVVINDVAGAVNVINLTDVTIAEAPFSANGLGNNTFNYTCTQTKASSSSGQVNPACDVSNITGFTTMNVFGTPINLNAISVTGNINLNPSTVIFTSSFFGAENVVSAENVVIGSNTLLQGAISPLEVSGGIATLDSIGSITGNLVNNGTVNLGSATLNVSGNASFNAGSTLMFAVGKSQTGKIDNNGTATFDSNSLVIPTVKADAQVKNGQSFVIANNASGLPTVQNDTGFFQWVASENTGNLVLTVDVGVPAFLASQVSTAGSNAVDQVFANEVSDRLPLELQTYLLQLRGENVVRAAERLRPEINDGAMRTVLGNTDKVFSMMGSRMLDHYLSAARSARLGSSAASNSDSNGSIFTATASPIYIASTGANPQLGLTGIAGDAAMAASTGIWVQGFGDRGSQDSLRGADGYNSSSTGFASGVDRPIDDAGDKRLGFAFAYARGNITDTGNTINNRTDTNSFLGSVYGSWAMEQWYLSGAMGVGRNTYQSQRHLGPYSTTSNHDSWQFSSRVDTGWPLLLSDSLTLVPIASLDYSHLNESGYTEDGKEARVTGFQNGTAINSQFDSPINLQVQGRSFDSIRSSLGGKLIYSLQQPTWAAELELRGMYRHEFADLAQNSVARLTSFGTSFSSPGLQPERDSFLIGSSVRLTGDDENDQMTVLASYDADIRDKYFGQVMSLNLRYDFDGAPRYLKQAKARLAAQAAKTSTARSVKATDKDIAAMQQAMLAVLGATEAPLSAADLQKQQAVDAAIQSWAQALSSKRLDAYFNSYAASFTTPDGSTRQQWERKRKSEISQEANPAIKISDMTIAPQGDHALAVFTQTVDTGGGKGNVQESVQKIVDLEQKNGRWLIVREDSLAMAD